MESYFHNRIYPQLMIRTSQFMEADQQVQEREGRDIIADRRSQDRIVQAFTRPGALKVTRVLAAPGTGKTTTGCNLIKGMFLDAQKPLYPNFLFLTFTRRTRADLVRKIYDLKGCQPAKKQYALRRIRNFHSLAFGLVLWEKVIQKQEEDQAFDRFLGETYIQTMGNSQKFNYQRERVRRRAWKISHKFIAQAYTEQEEQQELERLRRQPRSAPIIQLINAYKNWLEQRYREQRAVTYDQAISMAIKRINQNKPCLGINLDELDLIIVDEFQDSNPAQIKLIQSLMNRSKRDPRLLLFGDYDQNIFMWRGAKFQPLQNFIEGFPMQQMFLEESYRLSPSVLDISQRLITSDPAYNNFREKFYRNYNIRAMNRQRDHPLVVKEFASQYSEVRWVVEKIYQHLDNGFQPQNITILLRAINGSYFYQKLKVQLNRKEKENGRKVPIDFQNSGSSLGSEAGKYILALLKYFYQVHHLHNLRGNQKDISRILQLKQIGDGDDARKNMKEHRRIDIGLKQYKSPARRAEERQASWRQFFLDFQRIREIVLAKEHIIDTLTGIHQILKDANTRWFSKKFQSNVIEEFIDAVEEIAYQVERTDHEEYLRQPTMAVIKRLVENMEQKLPETNNNNEEIINEEEPQRPLNRRRRDLALLREQEVRAARKRLQVQTMHNAKGLQYPIVFICGLDFEYVQYDYDERENRPHNLSDAELKRIQDMERDAVIEKQSEELRLIYTAITRTSGFVYVCSSQKDNYNSSRFPPLGEHKVFARLKELCGITEVEPYVEQKDDPFKSEYWRIQREKKEKKEKRREKSRGRGRGRGRET